MIKIKRRYGVRGPERRSPVTAFPGLLSATLAAVGDEVVVVSNNGGRNWSTLDEYRVNLKCRCCGPLDLGACICVSYCGVIRCSQMDEKNQPLSVVEILISHQREPDGSCLCGFPEGAKGRVSHARHVVSQLTQAGYEICCSDEKAEKL